MAASVSPSYPNETPQLQYRVVKTAVVLDEMDAAFVEWCARYYVQKTVENSDNYKVYYIKLRSLYVKHT
jgi:hypothetical protein